ncbi:MAG: electron transfer flavoprotein subunit alpha/FixB family protein [Sulfolobales archaeon]
MKQIKVLVVGEEREINDLSGVVHQIINKFPGGYSDALLRVYSENSLSKLEKVGYRKIYYTPNKEGLDTYEEVSEAITKVYDKENYDLIITFSTKLYKEIAGYVSQKIKLPVIPDVSSINFSNETIVFIRSVMAGRVRSLEKLIKKAFVLIGLGRSAPTKISDTKTVTEPIELVTKPKIKIIERKPKRAAAVKLEEADIIISVGRGFKSEADIKAAFELAEILGGQVGCSRPIAADLKWLPEEHWVGLSGKKVKPKLYLALGISGQPQHIAGIIDSRIVVAVNKDPNAPIFKNADYGIVGDLYEFLPIFTKKVREILKK